MSDGNRSPTPTLSARLEELIRRRSTGSGTLTNEQLADALKATDPTLKVSGAYLSALRTGKRTRPSAELQVALARFFEVPVSFLVDLDHEPSIATQIAELDEMSLLGVKSIALRAVGLNSESLSTVAAVLDHVRQLQGLPAITDDVPTKADDDG